MSLTPLTFTVNAGEGKSYQCRFVNLATGITPRHSDTVDVRFLVNGKPLIIALAHPAFARFRVQHRRTLTDAESIDMAGLFLKELLARNEQTEDPIILVPFEKTLQLAERVVASAAGDGRTRR